MNYLRSTPSPNPATPPQRLPASGGGGEAAPLSRPSSLTASAGPHTPLTVKGLLDVVLLVVAAPVLLTVGVPSRAYLIAAGAWIVLRGVGVAVDRIAQAVARPAVEIVLRLVYLMGRLFTLAILVVLLRHSDGRHAALTALLVMLIAFTIEMSISFVYRPRRR